MKDRSVVFVETYQNIAGTKDLFFHELYLVIVSSRVKKLLSIKNSIDET